MKLLRKEDLSLYYYIKDIVLTDFVEQEDFISLTMMESLSSDTSSVYQADTTMIPSPTSEGRGWKYFDTISGTANSCSMFDVVSGTRYDGVSILGSPEQSNMIQVYDTDYNLIDSEYYIIDYVDGRIITMPDIEPAFVSYYWNYISVVDEWNGIDASKTPIVVVDVNASDKIGYQLGAGKKVTRKVELNVFATSSAERNDITETLYDGLYLKGCPLLTFPLGTVLDYDGTWHGRKTTSDKLQTLFDVTTVSGIERVIFENVKSRNVNLDFFTPSASDDAVLSDLNQYRAKVSFDMISYTQS